MSSGYQHSIKVPTQYKNSAKILKKALEGQNSLRNLVFEEKHVRIRGAQAVLKHFADNRTAIEAAISKSRILEENPRLCPFLCRILISELLFGRKQLIGESKPVQTVQSYYELLKEHLGTEIKKPEVKKDDKPRYVRVNTLLTSMEEVHQMLTGEGFRQIRANELFEKYDDFLNIVKSLEEDQYIKDMHVPDVLIFHSSLKSYWPRHNFVQEKKLMLQDKATSLVVELLDPTPGSTVLDMCAAPGMKTIQICNKMRNEGKIYAIEQNQERYNVLCKMTETAGCQIVDTKNCDALSITDKECPDVEYVLVDPSCSGSGMQKRLSLTSKNYETEVTANRLRKLAGLQIKMLAHAMTAFPKVKRVIYSTCSLNIEENEQVVERCLQLAPNFKLLSGSKALRKKWNNVGDRTYEGIGKNCLYAKPKEDLTDGIFIALFARKADN